MLAFSLLFVAVLFFSRIGDCADVKKGIRVGNAGAFTGDAAAPCMEIFNSSQLAVDGWNAKGGIQGVKIIHVMGDDAMNPAQGVNVAQKFTADPLIYGIIGPPMSHMAQATMKIYGRANLVCITTAASKPDLTQQGFKHFFRVNARNDAHGWNCALFMQKNLKAKKVAVLNEKVAYCEKIASDTISGLKKLGITDVMQDTIVGGARDYSMVLSKVKDFNPNVLFFVATTARDHAIGVRQAKELGIEAEGAAEGAYVYHFAPDVFAIPEAAGYRKKFEGKYGALSSFGPPAYEAMNILLTAIDKAAKDGQISREEVLKAVSETKNFKGILGFPVSFDKRGDLASGATYFFKVEGKDFKQVAVMTGK